MTGCHRSQATRRVITAATQQSVVMGAKRCNRKLMVTGWLMRVPTIYGSIAIHPEY
ncbi:hypothetical protein PAXRUDRAFT_829873 [Paxillus rubicundulus Ve08.2h10]|uniref:Uncharacterized protein n=1 Tax=Paxillus rubicundulus Ve08.2h10 TaxID=930991 RepID=A0A0D0D6R6_9AGAM|nr:hypothetical protein PAXRUDRAFT_829873 [Paxillus rubicundulus Ve08.2h10]